MAVFILILALILAVVAVVFAIQNPVVVTAALFGFSMKGSLALFVLIGVGVGIVIGVLVMMPGALKSAVTIARHRKRISGLEKSLEERKSSASGETDAGESAGQ